MSTSTPALPAFAGRHIGPREDDVEQMLAVVGRASLDDLIDTAVPGGIRGVEALDIEPAESEAAVLAELRQVAARNRRVTSMIGLGYYGTLVPAVVQRNVLENPAWYTAYTPYQPEISQGRLEALLNFQTVVSDLTGLAISGASLLDEATAAAEAMTLMRRSSKAPADAVLVVDPEVFPQTLAVVRTRALPLGIPVVEADLTGVDSAEALRAAAGGADVFGVLVQYPAMDGQPPRLAGPGGRRPRGRGAGHGRRRPPRPHPRDAAGGVGRRRRHRDHPAAGGARRLRRPARRLHERAAGPGAHHAGPPRRGVGRRRRRTRLPARPPDPRAAHPPREGDVEHLHRAGAPRRHGEHVRRLPRSGRADGDRPAHPRAHDRAGRGPDLRWRRARRRAVLRHAAGPRPRPGRRGRRPGPRGRPQPVAGRRRHRPAERRRDDRRPRPPADLQGLRGRGHR